MASILERVARGEHVSETEVREALNDQRELAALQRLYDEKLKDFPQIFAQVQSLLQGLQPQLVAIRHDIHAARQADNREHRYLFQQSEALPSLIESSVRRTIENAMAPLTGPQPVYEATFTARVDEARARLRRGEPGPARQLLEQVVNETRGQHLTPRLQCLIAGAFGACAYQTHQTKEAVSEFRRAYALEPETADGLVLGGLASLLDGDPSEGYRLSHRALEIDSRSHKAAAAHLQCLDALGRTDAIEAFISEHSWVEGESASCLVLSDIFSRQGNGERAAALARKALELNPNDPDACQALAVALVYPLQRRGHLPLPRFLTAEESASLTEAEEALTGMVVAARAIANTEKQVDAYGNRAGVRRALGRLGDAMEDCNAALALDPANDFALSTTGLLLLHQRNEEEAISNLERVRDCDLRRQVCVQLGRAYLDAEAPEKARDAVAPYWDPTERTLDQLDIADVLMTAYDDLERAAKADIVAQLVRDGWGDDPYAVAVLAERANRNEDTERAREMLEEVLPRADGPARLRASAQLAALRYYDGNPHDAVELLESIVAKDVDTRELRLYIRALYHADRKREALDLAKAIRTRGILTSPYADIEAELLAYIGDIEAVSSLLQGMIREWPEHVINYVNLAMQKRRSGDPDGARRIIEAIPPSAYQSNPGAMLVLAEVRAELRMPQAAALAFRAWRLGFDDVDIHTRYLRLFFPFDGPHAKAFAVSPTVVTVDTAVELVRGDERRTYILLDEDGVVEDRGEIALTDERAVALLGRHHGDRVNLLGADGSPLEFEVVEVMSKQVAAWRQSMMKVAERPREETGFWVLGGPGRDPVAAIKEMVLHQSGKAEDPLRLYREQPIPLSAVAAMRGRSLVETWEGFTQSPGAHLLSGRGGEQDRLEEAKAIAGEEAVVMDLTAILTVVLLGLEDQLAHRFRDIMVPQSVFDALLEHEALVNEFTPNGWLASQDGKFSIVETPPKYTVDRRSFAARAVDFVKHNCTLVPTAGLLDVPGDELPFLGSPGAGAIVAARERGLPLYSDDMRLRQYGVLRGVSKGFWTETLLQDMRVRGQLSDDAYFAAVQRLINTGYTFVSVNHEFYVWLFERSGYEITPLERHMLGILKGPACTEDSALRVVTGLLPRVWKNAETKLRRILILDECLRVLASGRDWLLTTWRLRLAIYQATTMDQRHRNAILQRIDEWGQPMRLGRRRHRVESHFAAGKDGLVGTHLPVSVIHGHAKLR